MLTVDEARKKIMDSAVPFETRMIAIENALTYVTVNDVKADRPLPPFNRVAMDGFAVKSADFVDGKATLKIVGHIQTGITSNYEIQTGQTVQIMTGAPCPDSADAVVKIENAVIKGDRVELTDPKIKPGGNIAPRGEDAEAGKILVKKGSLLTTTAIAICASVGLEQIEVYNKPSLRIISTGSEIIPPSQTPLPHQIRDCNSFAIRSAASGMKLDTTFIGIGEDETDVLAQMIKEGLKGDILLLSGGVSMGEYDHIPGLLAKAGVEKILHNVLVKPGKPLWFGKAETGCYVFGLPGNPVSVQTCFRVFVEPFIRKLSGQRNPENVVLRLPLSETLISKTKREHFMPGRLVRRDDGTYVQPIIIRGSGDFANFERSQGLIRVPLADDVLEPETMVDFLPWREIW